MDSCRYRMGDLFASIAIYADGDVCTGIVFLMFACMFAVPITGINEDLAQVY